MIRPFKFNVIIDISGLNLSFWNLFSICSNFLVPLRVHIDCPMSEEFGTWPRKLMHDFSCPTIDNYKGFTWQDFQGKVALSTGDLVPSQCITVSERSCNQGTPDWPCLCIYTFLDEVPLLIFLYQRSRKNNFLHFDLVLSIFLLLNHPLLLPPNPPPHLQNPFSFCSEVPQQWDDFHLCLSTWTSVGEGKLRGEYLYFPLPSQ